MNILLDWNEANRPGATESRSLLADWLREEVDFRITDEAFSDAHRDDDSERRRRRRALVRGIGKIDENRERAAAVLAQLREIVGPRDRRSDASDLRHLASTIASSAAAFVTRDEDILAWAERVDEHFGIAVLRPAEFILRLDEIIRSDEYAPLRLAGSAVTTRRIGSSHIECLSRSFLATDRGEKVKALRARMSAHLADPHHSHGLMIEWPASNPIATLIFDRTEERTLRVPVFRFKESRVTSTMMRHACLMVIREALDARVESVVITEPYPTLGLGEALSEFGFARCAKHWCRAIVAGWREKQDVAEILATHAPNHADDVSAVELEQRLWPVKIRNVGLRSFIVPIQPRWAMHLFDEGLSRSALVGCDPMVMFSTEHAYYRSAHVPVVTAPSRVLWYVSDDGDSSGVQAVRGCSTVMAVETGPAKQLFRKYRRLGVYEWWHLMEHTGRDPLGQLMVIVFGPTECLKVPVPRRTISGILHRHGRPMPPLSMPVEIPEDCFEEIHKIGIGEAPASTRATEPSASAVD